MCLSGSSQVPGDRAPYRPRLPLWQRGLRAHRRSREETSPMLARAAADAPHHSMHPVASGRPCPQRARRSRWPGTAPLAQRATPNEATRPPPSRRDEMANEAIAWLRLGTVCGPTIGTPSGTEGGRPSPQRIGKRETTRATVLEGMSTSPHGKSTQRTSRDDTRQGPHGTGANAEGSAAQPWQREQPRAIDACTSSPTMLAACLDTSVLALPARTACPWRTS